ncbi:MAG: gluconate 2-dehydrogenase subunit 3 family protein [Halomonas sp.]|nr:gluconate 2-dehydrogenase subunit 3 family protein [Halomonas sp.]MDP3536402.1 gluconate 2-dehydrogenase subunit 3 family protein [Halomonas sp.]
MHNLPDNTRAALSRVHQLSRRDFLKAAGGLAMVASMSTGLLGAAQALADMPTEIRVMSTSEYAVMHRLMEVALPTAGTSLVPPTSLPVMQTLDAALLEKMAPHLLAGLKEGIAYFNDGPREEYDKPFVELTDAEAVAFCDAWADSDEIPQRALAMGLKKLVGLAYWAHPPTWEPLGYGGPVTERWGLKSLGNAPMPLSDESTKPVSQG